MSRIAVRSALYLAALVWALLPAVADLQGVAVFTGRVTIDGKPAPAGTTVEVRIADGTAVGTAVTGTVGLTESQYRIDMQPDPRWQGKVVSLMATSDTGSASVSVTFPSNQPITQVVRQDINIVTFGVVSAERFFAPIKCVLEIASAFNYTTGLYEGYVPELPGNPLKQIKPNSVVVFTMKQDVGFGVSGVTFYPKANVSTPVPVGATARVDSPVCASQSAPVLYSLAIAVNGQGSTSPFAGTSTFPAGASVTISAVPAGGWKFDGWSGDASGLSPTVAIRMDGNKNVTANFSMVNYTL